jgi:hypothetical protein
MPAARVGPRTHVVSQVICPPGKLLNGAQLKVAELINSFKTKYWVDLFK